MERRAGAGAWRLPEERCWPWAGGTRPKRTPKKDTPALWRSRRSLRCKGRIPQQREVGRPEDSWEEEEEALVTPASPGDTQGSSESHCSQGRSPSQTPLSQPQEASLPIFLPTNVLSLVPAFQTLLRGAWGGCPNGNIPTAVSLKTNKGCVLYRLAPASVLLHSHPQGPEGRRGSPGKERELHGWGEARLRAEVRLGLGLTCGSWGGTCCGWRCGHKRALCSRYSRSGDLIGRLSGAHTITAFSL